MNFEGDYIKSKHKDNEHSKFEGTNKNLKKGHTSTRTNKHGKLEGANMNLTGDSLDSKHEENEHRKAHVHEYGTNVKEEGSKRKRKHDKHDKGKTKVKKSERKQVKAGNLIISDNYSGEDIPGKDKRKSSDLSNSQGTKSASVMLEPGMQDCSSSISESDLMKILNPMKKACSKEKYFNDVRTNNHSVALNDMKPESDVQSCQKSRDNEYLYENPEEQLFFSILHKYLHYYSKNLAKTKQELTENNVLHLLQQGKWRQSEVMQLKMNMDYFKETYPSCDPEIFLYNYKFPSKGKGQERLEYRNLRRCFLRCLGFKIRRFLTNVCTKAVLYFFQGKTGKFTPSEVKLIREHGDMKSTRRFAKLASKLNRHYMNINWVYKNLGDEQKRRKGPWTSEEDKILLRAVKTAQVQLGGDSAKGLPWTEISRSVQTRPPVACHTRYLLTLRWREVHKSTFKPPVSTADKIRLIEMICESNVQEEVEIDWHSMLKDFPEASSPSSMQMLWHRLKIKVPDYSCKNLDEITDYLAKFEIPKLKRKLEKKLQRVEDNKKVPVLRMEDN